MKNAKQRKFKLTLPLQQKAQTKQTKKFKSPIIFFNGLYPTAGAGFVFVFVSSTLYCFSI